MDCPLWRAKRMWPLRRHAAPGALKVSNPECSMVPCGSAADAKRPPQVPQGRAAGNGPAQVQPGETPMPRPNTGPPASPVEEVWSSLRFELLAGLSAEAQRVLLVVRSFPARPRAAHALSACVRAQRHRNTRTTQAAQAASSAALCAHILVLRCISFQHGAWRVARSCPLCKQAQQPP